MNNKNPKKLAFLLVFSLFLSLSLYNYANAANDDTRYLVKSNSNFWKKSFGVRHEFKDGFTTDLSDWQLRLTRMFNIEVTPVIKLNILTEASAEATGVEDISGTGIKGKPSPSPSLRPTPSAQLPWGIKAVYNFTKNPLLDKTSGGAGVNVAVLDTGVLRTHLDLQRRIKQCKDFTAVKQPITDDKCEDKNGHGTHVAGIIAADGGLDGKGVYGVAPESNLYIYKVCGINGSCWSDDIATAIKTAVEQKANVINMSLGSDVEDTLIKNAINDAVNAGVLVVAAAGNDGPDAGSIDYPGANPNVIAVGAFDSSFDMADWSSRGINSTTASSSIDYGDIEFAAPGVIVESTWKDGGYVILSGTSMATPHISGLAAKLWQSDVKEGQTSASATRNLLKTFAEDLLPAGQDDASGFGFPHL